MRNLTINDYLDQGLMPESPLPHYFNTVANDTHPDPTDCEATSAKLYDLRARFTKRFELSVATPLCHQSARSAVLTLIAAALRLLSPTNHRILYTEVILKMQVILGIEKARPADMLFTTHMLLTPLEPQYADPRIDPWEDRCGYKMDWRVQAWRREGWPSSYPWEAVAEEGKGRALPGMKQREVIEL